MRSSLIFLTKTLADFYLLTFLLRFILQWIRADFYNPFAQSIVKITNPLILPLRRVVPTSNSVDVPTLVALVLLETIVTWVLVYISGISMTLNLLPLLVLYRIISLTLWFYSISIFVYVILSWIGQGGYNPIASILSELNEPLLRPFRRILPPLAGLDLSPLLALILIQAGHLAIPLPGYLG